MDTGGYHNKGGVVCCGYDNHWGSAAFVIDTMVDEVKGANHKHGISAVGNHSHSFSTSGVGNHTHSVGAAGHHKHSFTPPYFEVVYCLKP